MNFKILLVLSISVSSTFSLANNPIADDTNQIEILEVEPKSREQRLIENLLGGLDLKINELLTNQDSETSDSQYKVVFSLVANNESDVKTVIEIFSTDEFSSSAIANIINKEFYIPSNHIFKALEPHLDLIEKSEKLKLEVSLNKVEQESSKLNENTILEKAEPLTENINVQVDDQEPKENSEEPLKQVLQKQDFEVYFRSSI